MSDTGSDAVVAQRRPRSRLRWALIAAVIAVLALAGVGAFVALPLLNQPRAATELDADHLTIRQVCEDATRATLALAVLPSQYSADTALPLAARQELVQHAEQVLPQYYTGAFLDRELATFRSHIQNNALVQQSSLVGMTFTRVDVHGSNATARGHATFAGMSVEHTGATPAANVTWVDDFVMTLVKVDGRWLISDVAFSAHP